MSGKESAHRVILIYYNEADEKLFFLDANRTGVLEEETIHEHTIRRPWMECVKYCELEDLTLDFFKNNSIIILYYICVIPSQRMYSCRNTSV